MTSIFRIPVTATAIAGLLALGLVAAPQPALAGSDFIKGVIVGGGIAAIVNEANKNKSRKSTTTRRATTTASKPKRAVPAGPRVTIATFPTTRDQVRIYQTRLNTLGYNAGTPDGLYGRMTRTAVSNFQASIGAAITGKLSEADASVLVQRTSQPLIAPGTAGQGFAAAGQPPAPVFPQPGAAPQMAGAAPAPAFPAPGGAQQPTMAGTAVGAAPAPAFPTLGGAGGQAPAVAAPAPAFPAIAPAAPAGQMAAVAPAPAPQSTFPQVAANAATAPQASAPASAPAFGNQQAAFPAVPVAVASGAAALAPAAPQGGGFQPTVALPAAAAPNPAPAAPAAPQPEVVRFTILGASTGSPLSDVTQQFAFEGLTQCETVDHLMHCSAASDAVQDLVAVRTEDMPDGSVQVGAMSRHLTFAQPMPAADLRAMMADRYAGLLEAPGQMVGTADCLTVANLTTGGRSELTARIMSGDNAGLAKLARSCSYFSRIVFGAAGDGAMVDEVSIFIFDGAVFSQGLSARQPAKIKF